ncbi:MAG: MBL fold metallo-hydrolase [Bryobacteraceae bacterium]
MRLATIGLILRVWLVGTGGPELTPNRAGIATLVNAGDQNLLFDVGRGALDGIYSCRIRPQDVSRVFLTHLHNDHIEGLPTLWMTPWFLLGRKQNLQVWGPPGTREMIEGMRRMYGHDLEKRANAVFKREYLDIEVHEIAAGVVYSAGGVKVTAIPVEHHDGNPAFAYRVEESGRSVLLTGDTTLTDGLLSASKGVDVLISNVAAGSQALESSGAIDPILNKLMRPEQAATLFRTASPQLAVYSHIVKKELPDAAVLERTRKAGYAGRLQMGEDGMKITIGDKIQIDPPLPRTSLPDFDSPRAIF